MRAPEQAAAPARDAAGRPGIRLAGLMAYEAQIAGVGDDPPGRPVYGAAVRYLQRKSAAGLALRRAAVVATVPACVARAGRSADSGRELDAMEWTGQVYADTPTVAAETYIEAPTSR